MRPVGVVLFLWLSCATAALTAEPTPLTPADVSYLAKLGQPLKGLTANWGAAAELVAQFGCPLGSICSELAKGSDESPAIGAEVFGVLSTWVEAQFRELGHRDAADLALMMISGIQGAALLSNSFRDPSVMTREVRQLDRWIDSLA